MEVQAVGNNVAGACMCSRAKSEGCLPVFGVGTIVWWGNKVARQKWLYNILNGIIVVLCLNWMSYNIFSLCQKKTTYVSNQTHHHCWYGFDLPSHQSQKYASFPLPCSIPRCRSQSSLFYITALISGQRQIIHSMIGRNTAHIFAWSEADSSIPISRQCRVSASLVLKVVCVAFALFRRVLIRRQSAG